eukprot:45663_1
MPCNWVQRLFCQSRRSSEYKYLANSISMCALNLSSMSSFKTSVLLLVACYFIIISSYPAKCDRHPHYESPIPSEYIKTPSYLDTTSSDYAPTSSDYISTSSDYAPTSSDYAPTSSDYAPTPYDYAPTSSDDIQTPTDLQIKLPNDDYAPFSPSKSPKNSYISEKRELFRRWRRWNHTEPECYSYDFQKICFCLPETTQKRSVLIQMFRGTHIDPESGLFDSKIVQIQWQFQNLLAAYESDFDEIRVTYDENYHFPTEVYIDQSTMIIDEEQTYIISNFQDHGGAYLCMVFFDRAGKRQHKDWLDDMKAQNIRG